MTEIEVFENDFKIAEEQKSTINANIEKWNDLYEGKPYGNETKNHSPMVWKMVQKQGETLMANLAKPFISSYDSVIVDPVTDMDVYKSKIDEGLLNHYHDKRFDKNKFYKDLARVMTKEGTGWIRAGWNKVNKRKSIKVGAVSPESAAKLEAQGFEIVQKEDGIYIEKDNVLVNEPTARILKNGRVYTDPLADTAKDMRFLIYEYETSLMELKAQESLYDPTAIAKIERQHKDLESNYFTDVSSVKMTSDGFRNYADKARKKIKLYEWWGDYDIDKDGIPVPCVMVVGGTKKDRILLSVKKNPYPFKKIPFVPVPCITDLYSVWGKPIAYLIEDIQYLYTMLMRGVLDNTANSNNAQKFIKKGSLDPTNFRRMMAKEPVVEVNTTDNISTAVMDGGYNAIPNSIFNLFAMLDQEAEAMTGISKMMQGVTGKHLNAPAGNFQSTLSMSQIRLLDITNNVANAMKEVMSMWISMALEYLDEAEIKTITGIDIDKLKVKETQLLMEQYKINELPEDVAQKAQLIIMEEVDDLFDREDLPYDIKIKVGTDGVKEIRINQLNMLMQQVGGLSGMVDPMILKDLLAEYADLMDFPATAAKIKDYVPQPDPSTEQAKQLELAKLSAEAEKEKALAENASARARQIMIETEKGVKSFDADVANKYADVAKKYSEVENATRDRDIKEFEAGSKAGNESAKISASLEDKKAQNATKNQ